MNETTGDENRGSGADEVDADESLDAPDTEAPDDAPAQPGKAIPGGGRSANIGHT